MKSISHTSYVVRYEVLECGMKSISHTSYIVRYEVLELNLDSVASEMTFHIYFAAEKMSVRIVGNIR
jgi:hypothetical protein